MRRNRRRLIAPLVVLAGVSAAASAQAAVRDTPVEPAPVVSAAPSPDRELLASYQGGVGWRGPRIALPAGGYQAITAYHCEDSGFLYLSWNGEGDRYETEHSSAAQGAVVVDGKGGTRGYFSVDTWIGCSWTLKVYSAA